LEKKNAARIIRGVVGKTGKTIPRTPSATETRPRTSHMGRKTFKVFSDIVIPFRAIAFSYVDDRRSKRVL